MSTSAKPTYQRTLTFWMHVVQTIGGTILLAVGCFNVVNAIAYLEITQFDNAVDPSNEKLLATQDALEAAAVMILLGIGLTATGLMGLIIGSACNCTCRCTTTQPAIAQPSTPTTPPTTKA